MILNLRNDALKSCVVMEDVCCGVDAAFSAAVSMRDTQDACAMTHDALLSMRRA